MIVQTTGRVLQDFTCVSKSLAYVKSLKFAKNSFQAFLQPFSTKQTYCCFLPHSANSISHNSLLSVFSTYFETNNHYPLSANQFWRMEIVSHATTIPNKQLLLNRFFQGQLLLFPRGIDLTSRSKRDALIAHHGCCISGAFKAKVLTSTL